MSRFTKIATSIVVLLAALISAAAIDDGRFWVRYLDRLPGILGIPGAGSANSVPSLRATIAGGKGAPLQHCAAQGPLAEAVAASDRWMMAHNTEAFLVWHDGCLIHEHYTTGTAATARGAGAMAKSLMALVAGRAIREGYLTGIDQPVATNLAEWREDGRRAIRYRDLLDMHAGLAWYRQTPSPFGDFQRIIIGSDYAPRVLGLTQVASPGRLYDYSAWTYDVLGIALARAGHRPYEQLASDLIAKPLGLGDSRIYVDRPGGTVHGNCCLYGRADDWIRLGAFVVAESRSPRLLPAGFAAQMRTSSPDQPNYGLGTWLGSPYTPKRIVASPRNPYPTPVKSVIAQSEPFVADDVMVFEGVENNKVWIVPSRGLVIVRFGKATKSWDDAAVPNLLMRALP